MARPDTDINAFGTAAGTPAVIAEAERIAAALEPELRRVIDTTMERVAEIEQQTLHEARELMVSSEQDSQDALERSSRLVNSLEALTGTVSQVTSTLRTEVGDVTEALRGLRESRVDLPQELTPRRFDGDPERAQPAPVEAEPEPEPEPEPEAEAEIADPEIEPSPELSEMFREQITRMRDDGKPRDEAERVLLRFRLGHRFLGMLDEIYATEVPRANARKSGLFGRFRRRSSAH